MIEQQELTVSEEVLEQIIASNNGDGPGGSQIIYGAPNTVHTRSMIVTGPVDEEMASAICAKLINFNIEDSESPVALYINTYGGSAYDMMAIYDIMQWVKCPVYTIGFGKIMSAGVLLLAAGEPGHRYCLPHTSIMIHRVRGGAIGTVEDIESSGAHMTELQQDMEKLLAKHSSIKKKGMKDFMSGPDSYIKPKEAKELGIIDHVSGVSPKVLLQ